MAPQVVAKSACGGLTVLMLLLISQTSIKLRANVCVSFLAGEIAFRLKLRCREHGFRLELRIYLCECI